MIVLEYKRVTEQLSLVQTPEARLGGFLPGTGRRVWIDTGTKRKEKETRLSIISRVKIKHSEWVSARTGGSDRGERERERAESVHARNYSTFRFLRNHCFIGSTMLWHHEEASESFEIFLSLQTMFILCLCLETMSPNDHNHSPSEMFLEAAANVFHSCLYSIRCQLFLQNTLYTHGIPDRRWGRKQRLAVLHPLLLGNVLWDRTYQKSSCGFFSLCFFVQLSNSKQPKHLRHSCKPNKQRRATERHK